MNGASCVETFDIGTVDASLDTITIASGALISSIIVKTDNEYNSGHNGNGLICQISGVYTDNAGSPTSFTDTNTCAGTEGSYTLTLNDGERITRVNAHYSSSSLRWIGFETLQPTTYALGEASNIESYPATDSFALEGPIT